MFGYSIALLLGRLFGIPLFVLGILFLRQYRYDDRPREVLRRCVRSGWVWLALVLTWIAFALEIVWVSSHPAPS